MRELEPYTIFVQDQSNLTFVLFTTVLPLASLEGYSSKEVEQKWLIYPLVWQEDEHINQMKRRVLNSFLASLLFILLRETQGLKTSILHTAVGHRS